MAEQQHEAEMKDWAQSSKGQSCHCKGSQALPPSAWIWTACKALMVIVRNGNCLDHVHSAWTTFPWLKGIQIQQVLFEKKFHN